MPDRPQPLRHRLGRIALWIGGLVLFVWVLDLKQKRKRGRAEPAA